MPLLSQRCCFGREILFNLDTVGVTSGAALCWPVKSSAARARADQSDRATRVGGGGAFASVLAAYAALWRTRVRAAGFNDSITYGKEGFSDA